MTLFWQPRFVMQICSLTGLCSTACLSPPGEKGKPWLEPPGASMAKRCLGDKWAPKPDSYLYHVSPVLEAQADSGSPHIPGGAGSRTGSGLFYLLCPQCGWLSTASHP